MPVHDGIHRAVLRDVLAAFRGKPFTDLTKAEELIKAKIASGMWEFFCISIVARRRCLHAVC